MIGKTFVAAVCGFCVILGATLVLLALTIEVLS